MSMSPQRYHLWIMREAERKAVDDARDELDRKSDQFADTTPFGQALRNYVDGIVGHPLHWKMVK